MFSHLFPHSISFSFYNLRRRNKATSSMKKTLLRSPKELLPPTIYIRTKWLRLGGIAAPVNIFGKSSHQLSTENQLFTFLDIVPSREKQHNWKAAVLTQLLQDNKTSTKYPGQIHCAIEPVHFDERPWSSQPELNRILWAIVPYLKIAIA